MNTITYNALAEQLQTMTDYLEESHIDELNSRHQGDSKRKGPDPNDCSYCREIVASRRLLKQARKEKDLASPIINTAHELSVAARHVMMKNRPTSAEVSKAFMLTRKMDEMTDAYWAQHQRLATAPTEGEPT